MRQNRRRFLVLFFKKEVLAFFLFFPAGPAAADPARVVVPISQTQLADGDVRYSVPVSVGGAPAIQALLDTGSTGLRVLEQAASGGHYDDSGFNSDYAYAAGDRLGGIIAMAKVSVGGAATAGPIAIEVVNSVECTGADSHCAGNLLDMSQYGIGGDGIAGAGFEAILGISLMSIGGAAYTDNPLARTGAARWIITLPEPGQGAPGQLILNPDAADMQGFTMFHLPAENGARGPDPAWLDFALQGCLGDTAGARLCGPTVLDTGSPAVIAYLPGVAPARLYAPGTPLSLTFGANAARPVTLPFAADSLFGADVQEAPASGPGTMIVAGLLPYLAYSVLYDDARGMIGFKPRNDAPDLRAIANEVSVIHIAPAGAQAASAPASSPAMPKVITPGP